MPSEKYFVVSVLCERNYCSYIPVEKDKVVGIDLGLKHFSILSDGEKINVPHIFSKIRATISKSAANHV
jgi:putative transposase